MNKPEFTIDEIFGDSLNLKLEEDFGVVEQLVSKGTEIPKLVKVHENGIEIVSDELLEKIKKKNLSASLISAILQCPADWLMGSYILPLIKHVEPIHFVRGHIFHETMEKFFVVPPEERTPKLLSQMAGEVVKTKYAFVMGDLETMHWTREALKGYLENFNYKDIQIAQIPKEKGKPPVPGIELFVKGKLGNTTRDIVGYVDRIDQLPNSSLQIVDYKTGKKINNFNPSEPVSDSNSFDYWRQQLAYTMLLEQSGYYIGGAKLEFPVAKGEVIVDVRNEHLREQVTKDFELVDSLLNKYVEDRFFPFKGHFFCKWCGALSPNFTSSAYGKLDVSWEEVSQHVQLL